MMGEAVRPIAELTVLMNVEQTKSANEMLARHLMSEGWSPDHVQEVCRFATTNEETLQDIQYAGGITPLVMMKAERLMTAPKVIGKCYTYSCKRDATVSAWGDIYCEPCYNRHKADIARRKLAR